MVSIGEKKSGSPLSISRLTPFLGAEVSGIDLSVATDSVHSLVRTHPVTQRKALYINMGLTVGIVDLSREESIKIIRDLNKHLNRPEYVYRHQLQVGDLIVCDNASVAHFAPYADQKYSQLQHRTTVRGTVHVLEQHQLFSSPCSTRLSIRAQVCPEVPS